MTVYVSSNDIVVSDDTVCDLVEELTFLGEGVSRKVYDLGDGTVLKLNANKWYHSAGDNETEWEAWQSIKDGPYASCFAECIAIAEDGSWLIQKAVEETFLDSDDIDAYSEWWRDIGRDACHHHAIGDVHPGNAGITANGNVLIIDYGWTGGFMDAGAMFGNDGESEVSDCQCSSCVIPPCDCGDCECSDCYPMGCDCGTLEGCHTTYCQACKGNGRKANGDYCTAVTRQWIEGEYVNLCEAHRVEHRSYRAVQIAWEVAGQIPMFDCRIIEGRAKLVPIIFL